MDKPLTDDELRDAVARMSALIELAGGGLANCLLHWKPSRRHLGPALDLTQKRPF